MKITLGIAAAAALSVALASAAVTTSADTTGTVTGRIVFEGKMPEMKPFEITADQSKGCCETGKSVDTTDRSLVVSKDNGIANVVVTIEVDGKEATALTESLKLDQKECRFEPHVSVVPTGTMITFLNSDSIAHNVHTYATKNDSFNQTIAPGAKHEQKLAKKDRIEIKCDIHPWMNSWLYVADTPYYAITDATGAFEIKGLPAGEYKVEVWHEKLGKGKGKATVDAEGKSSAVEIKLGETKKKRRR
jgi:plastocyanin